jgi:uncharacterized protein (DUF2062 family)
VACGAAISFTPFVGFHVVLGALLALIVRGNLLAVVAGTLVGNPWTFPFIWVASYEVGQYLLGGHAAGVQPAPWSFADVAGYVAEAARQAATAGPWVTVKRLATELRVVAWPRLVGGIPLGIITGLLIYFPLARAIGFYQLARQRRREKRAQRPRLRPLVQPPWLRLTRPSGGAALSRRTCSFAAADVRERRPHWRRPGRARRPCSSKRRPSREGLPTAGCKPSSEL